MKIKKIIIETVGSCNLKCLMCPTTHYGPKFKGIMSEKIFEMCLGHIKKDMIAILTGWGEPLLDKKLEQRIYSISKSGATVYIATNATLLTKERVKGLLGAGLNGLSISLDAGSKEIYGKIRGGDFDTVINNIKNLSLEREKVNPDFWIDMSIVTMKPNLEDLTNFLSLASRLGVNSVSITPKYLSFSEMDFKNYYIEPSLILKKLNQAQKSLNLQHPEVRTYALEHFPKDDCLAEAVSTVFISFKGDVSACCNLGHPAPRYDIKNKILLEPYTIYGNLEDKDLEEIWESSDFLDLRRNLKKGTVPFPCRGCALAPKKNE